MKNNCHYPEDMTHEQKLEAVRKVMIEANPEIIMICPYCRQAAIWCENKEIYGQNYGESYMCWLCKGCDAYVGCHCNTSKPLGTMANKELREWRVKAHAAFDPVWKCSKNNKYKILNDRKRRFKAYRRLAKELGVIRVHIGESGIEECKKIIEICKIIKFY